MFSRHLDLALGLVEDEGELLVVLLLLLDGALVALDLRGQGQDVLLLLAVMQGKVNY